jgi:hypothetical protein
MAVSPKREGVQHSSLGDSINAGQHIADWVAEMLSAHTK